MKIKIFFLFLSFIFLYSCATHRYERSTIIPKGKKVEKIDVSSYSFVNGEKMPEKHTCYGENISPHLKWENIPPETKSLVIMVEDPTAFFSNWTHWLVYNIPPNVNELEENLKADKILPNSIKQGENIFIDIGYKGPCPKLRTHTYFFRVFAIDIETNMKTGLKRNEVKKVIKDHIIGYGFITGKY